ncbi:MAG: response regulator [Pirellulaceae bacterium]
MSNQVVGRPMEILLVEDGLLDARATIEALRQGEIQHRLTLVRDGQEALEFLHQDGRFSRAPRPDLILLDLMLPKRTGTEVLTEIRRDFSLRTIPVVVLTASDTQEDKAACELLEVDSYITKPVNSQKFLDVVRQLKRFWLDDVVIPTEG